ncbi:porin PorA family protein [Corynebacterium endometrii]|uniref:DUF3068 domain-containing protein n=1 Tax=Corynebacterium endometrii TaxID=2488819 RepID=A0A4P7QK57_9CORY|nr:porin PorA family protein [Corynebacterium endometrii]QCB29354.1 hypothetical protein CENDO_10505 [Corynebacterium endometrii]
MRAFFTSRDPLRWVIIGAIISLLIGAVLPPLFENRSRPLALDIRNATATAHADARMLDVANAAGGEEAARPGNPERPGCSTAPAPLRCYQVTATAQLRHEYATSPDAEDDSLANLDSTMRVVVGGQDVARIEEHSLLNRESTYPARGENNSQSVAVGDLDPQAAGEGSAREGLRFFFPSATEQRSYPYYDPMTGSADPIDFVRTEKVDGVPAYVFYQKVSGINLAETVGLALELGEGGGNPALRQSPGGPRAAAPARIFYSDKELAEFGYRRDEIVAVDPWYAVDRTFWVEPTTGIVLNVEEKVYSYLAADKEQAETMAQRPWSEERTLFASTFNWDEESRDKALAEVGNTVTGTKVMSVLSWLGKGVAIVLLATAGWMLVRRRNASTDGLTAEAVAADARPESVR